MQLYSGKDVAIGGHARGLYTQIQTIAELAKADVRIASRGNDPGPFMEAFSRRLKVYAATHFLEPVPGGVAHCAARRGNVEDLALAECLKISATMPEGLRPDAGKVVDYVDFRFSGALPCLKCPLCVALKSNQRVLDQKLARLEDAVARAPSDAARADRNIAYLNFRDQYLRSKAEANRGLE